MSTFRTPVGPQPSSVYWRRRLVVGLGVLAVIIAIVLIIVGPTLFGGGAKDDAAKTPGASNSPVAPDTSNPDQPCAPADIAVAAVTDKDSYQVNEQPQVSLTITNTSNATCTFSAGTDVQEYTITSGDDVIWASTDCQTEEAAFAQVLEPGKAVSTTPFPWDRTRSSGDTCEGERPAVTAGGATYRLKVAVNGVESAADKPFLLY